MKRRVSDVSVHKLVRSYCRHEPIRKRKWLPVLRTYPPWRPRFQLENTRLCRLLWTKDVNAQKSPFTNVNGDMMWP